MSVKCMEKKCTIKTFMTFMSFSMIVMTVVGLTKISGIFYKIFTEKLEAEGWYIGLLVSLKDGGVYLLGPVAGALCNRFGNLRVISVGIILSSTGLFISAFTENIHVLAVFFGLLTGCGFGLVNLPSYALLPLVFTKKRDLTVSLVANFAGLSYIVYPLLINFFYNYYGISGTLIIISGLTFQCMTFCAIISMSHIRVQKNESKVIEIKLLKNKEVILLVLGNFFWGIAISVPYTIIPHQSILNGFTDFFSDSLLSMMGITNVISRISVPIALFLLKERLNCTLSFGVSNLLAAIPIIMITTAKTKDLLITTVITLGAFNGFQNCLYFPAIFRVIGAKNMTNAFGLMYFALGIGWLISSPMVGLIYDKTGGYELATLVACVSSITNSIIYVYLSGCIQNLCRCKKTKNSKDEPLEN